MEKLRCLRACVIRSLYHMYEPFAARLSKTPAIPESTPSTLKNSKVSGSWCWGSTDGLSCAGPVILACPSFPDRGGRSRCRGGKLLGASCKSAGLRGVASPRCSCCVGLAHVVFTLKLLARSLFSLMYFCASDIGPLWMVLMGLLGKSTAQMAGVTRQSGEVLEVTRRRCHAISLLSFSL